MWKTKDKSACVGVWVRPWVHAWVQACMGASVRGCMRGCKRAWVQACVGAWVHAWVRGWVRGCVRAWVHGCVGACMHGCMGAWVRACMGAWVHACVHETNRKTNQGCLSACSVRKRFLGFFSIMFLIKSLAVETRHGQLLVLIRIQYSQLLHEIILKKNIWTLTVTLHTLLLDKFEALPQLPIQSTCEHLALSPYHVSESKLNGIFSEEIPIHNPGFVEIHLVVVV